MRCCCRQLLLQVWAHPLRGSVGTCPRGGHESPGPFLCNAASLSPVPTWWWRLVAALNNAVSAWAPSGCWHYSSTSPSALSLDSFRRKTEIANPKFHDAVSWLCDQEPFPPSPAVPPDSPAHIVFMADIFLKRTFFFFFFFSRKYKMLMCFIFCGLLRNGEKKNEC